MIKNINHTPDEYNFLNKGDKIPDFIWKDETGRSFASEILRGKSTLIVLFTTECSHCRDNFAYLEKNLFQKNLSFLNILAIGRGCDFNQLEWYSRKYVLSIKLIADPDRLIYSGFAEKVVPRNYLFDPAGELLQSVRGYRPDEIDNMIRIISLTGTNK